MKIIPDEKLKEICKMGQGAECCIHDDYVLSGDGKDMLDFLEELHPTEKANDEN